MLRNPAGLFVLDETVLLFRYRTHQMFKLQRMWEISSEMSVMLSMFSLCLMGNYTLQIMSSTRTCWSLTGWKFIVLVTNFSLNVGTGRCKLKLCLQVFSSVAHYRTPYSCNHRIYPFDSFVNGLPLRSSFLSKSLQHCLALDKYFG